MATLLQIDSNLSDGGRRNETPNQMKLRLDELKAKLYLSLTTIRLSDSTFSGEQVARHFGSNKAIRLPLKPAQIKGLCLDLLRHLDDIQFLLKKRSSDVYEQIHKKEPNLEIFEAFGARRHVGRWRSTFALRARARCLTG